MEEHGEVYLGSVRAEGGVLEAIRKGYFQREIGRAAYEYQRQLDRKQRIQVGVDDFVEPDDGPAIPVLQIDPGVEQRQADRTRQRKRARDPDEVRDALQAVTAACRTRENLVPPVLEAVRRQSTLGEIVEAMRVVFGSYREPAIF
jgi:methylmalonyl-CoA mutase, N-terminal domain